MDNIHSPQEQVKIRKFPLYSHVYITSHRELGVGMVVGGMTQYDEITDTWHFKYILKLETPKTKLAEDYLTNVTCLYRSSTFCSYLFKEERLEAANGVPTGKAAEGNI